MVNHIEPAALELLTLNGFNSKIDDMRGDYNSLESCYNALEAIFFDHFKKNRYTSFESFRKCRERWLREKLIHVKKS